MSEVCAHVKWVVSFRLQDNGVKSYKRQCLKCGERLGEAIAHRNLPVPVELIPKYDPEIRERYVLELRTNERAIFRREYDIFLKSERWQELRRLIFKRCHSVCEGCGVATATQVHHLTYVRALGDEMLFDLVGLCDRCHAKVHPDKASPDPI